MFRSPEEEAFRQELPQEEVSDASPPHDIPEPALLGGHGLVYHLGHPFGPKTRAEARLDGVHHRHHDPVVGHGGVQGLDTIPLVGQEARPDVPRSRGGGAQARVMGFP